MNNLGGKILGFLMLTAMLILNVWIGYKIGVRLKPTAMDVYQGKTTLEITYKDGIAIDSVVVFKNKEEQQ